MFKLFFKSRFYTERTYLFAERWSKRFNIIFCIFLILGFLCGLFFSPSDYYQGDAFRIMYVHVPIAFLSIMIYIIMAFLALIFLTLEIRIIIILLDSCVVLGVLMTFLTLITGSIWGKPIWGTWWVWDARLTSELILFFIYLSIFIVGNSNYVNREKNFKIVSILILVGLVDLPIIHYSVIWWSTLHQGSTFSLFYGSKITFSMYYPLIMTLLGFISYCFWFVFQKICYEIILHEYDVKWIKSLIILKKL
ncbi:heme ABC transporter permease CcmC [Candidatus Legionella polyplacis]|uniref:Heme exporter protein C n=1 Tax=Candidatus Legionella polyplacis TaxID=2005262 RepID=A0ABZ2H0M6_9GAMM